MVSKRCARVATRRGGHSVAFRCEQLGYVSHASLGISFNGNLSFPRQMQRFLLAFTQACQQHDTAIRKFQHIVMHRNFALLICRKIAVLCAITLSRQGISPSVST